MRFGTGRGARGLWQRSDLLMDQSSALSLRSWCPNDASFFFQFQ